MSADGDGIRWVPVADVGEVRMGKQLSPAGRAAAGQMPYLRVANVHDGYIAYRDVKTMGFTSVEREIYGLIPGDILLNEGQSLELVGRSAIYTRGMGEFCFQNTLVRFRSGSGVLPQYAHAVFRRWLATGVFASIAKKTTSIAHLGGDRFARLPFPLISLEQQQRIVEVLDAVAEAERAAEAAREKLRTVRTGILTAAMKSVTAAQPAPGWVRVPLKEVVPSVEYGISEALSQDSRGVPTLRMNNLRDGLPELRDLRYCPTPVRAKILLRSGDVLFNRTNSIDHVGRAGIWNGELPEATFASYLVRLNPDTSRLTPEYLVEWLLHPAIRQRVRSIATVAVQQVNVNPSRLRELLIDLPENLDEQRRLTAGLAACDRRIAQEHDELSKLRTLKQGLADDLLSGRVRVDAQ
ncbi:restriction endonuclease subunit S [Streptomyces kronopolitis]